MMITKPGKNVLSPRAAPQFAGPHRFGAWRPHPGLEHPISFEGDA
jgi:hypothetical protein